MKQSIKKHLVTFDLGGVVVEVAKSVDEAARWAGVRLGEPEGKADRDKIRYLNEIWQMGTITDDDFFEEWSVAHGRRFSAREAAAISAGYLMRQYRGVREITDALAMGGIETGCLSNTCNHHWKVMRGDANRFPSVAAFVHPHASHLWGVMKPLARIYELYELQTGYEPGAIVFFDDLRENVEAARQRGWKAFQILPEREPSEQIRGALGELGIVV
jgi:FMN phosphatase YigB (HAD superfamily)